VISGPCAVAPRPRSGRAGGRRGRSRRVRGLPGRAAANVVEGAVEIERRPIASRLIHSTPKRLLSGTGSCPGSRRRTRARSDPDDAQRLPTTAQHGAEAIAHLESVGVGEGLARDHLVGTARLDPATATQMDVVQDRRPDRGSRPTARSRLGETRDVERHLRDDARLDRGYPGIAASPCAAPGARSSAAKTSANGTRRSRRLRLAQRFVASARSRRSRPPQARPARSPPPGRAGARCRAPA